MSRLPRLSRIAVSGAAVLALSTLAACGNDTAADPTPGSSPSVILPTDVDSATPSTESQEPTPQESDTPAGPTKVSKDDIIDIFTKAQQAMTTAHVVMTTTTAAGDVAMTGDMNSAATPPEMKMTMDMGSAGLGKMTVIMVDNTVYMNMGAATKNKFVKMTADQMASSGVDISQQVDPVKSMKEFVDAYQSGKFVGTDANGDHYRIVIDPRKVTGQLDGAAAGTLPKSMSMDMWIKDDKITVTTVDMGTLGSMKMVYSKWGEPVDVQAPPASQLITIPGM